MATFAELLSQYGQSGVSLASLVVEYNSHKNNNVKHGKYIEGMEYLRFYHDKVRQNQAVNLVWSGDSTTNGYAITDDNYKLNVAAKNMLNRFGLISVTSTNKGHDSAATSHWIASYLAEDLALNPDLYILRWGLNDGCLDSATRLATFTTNLRQGLATLRAAKTPEQMSVILMSPNSTNDPLNGRDATWHELILPVIKQAARDYQCCFIDTYNYLLDSTNAIWQDNPMPEDTDAHIHPLETANAWIISLMSEALIPTALRKGTVLNIPGSDATKDATDAPSTYPQGVSIFRTDAGFPYNGFVLTFYSADGIAFQINSGYQAQTKESIAIRRGYVNSGVVGSIGDDAWGGWIYAEGIETPTALSLQNSWSIHDGANYSSPVYYKSNGRVFLEGLISGGTTVQFDDIATALPVGYRPSKNQILTCRCAAGHAEILVGAAGELRIFNVSNNSSLCLDGLSFRVG